MFANAGDSAGITLISRDLLDIIAHGLMLVIMNGLPGLTSAAYSYPSSTQAPNPGEWASCLGSAKPIACDGPEGRPGRGGRERDNETAEEDGTVQHRSCGPGEPSRSAAG